MSCSATVAITSLRAPFRRSLFFESPPSTFATADFSLNPLLTRTSAFAAALASEEKLDDDTVGNVSSGNLFTDKPFQPLS